MLSKRFLSFSIGPPAPVTADIRKAFQCVLSPAATEARHFLPHHFEICRWELLITNSLSPFPHRGGRLGPSVALFISICQRVNSHEL